MLTFYGMAASQKNKTMRCVNLSSYPGSIQQIFMHKGIRLEVTTANGHAATVSSISPAFQILTCLHHGGR
jgi:hypothetical protein